MVASFPESNMTNVDTINLFYTFSLAYQSQFVVYAVVA